MKKSITSMVLLCILASCSLDDAPSSELTGRWVLNNVVCFCAFGENPNFGTHKVTFNNQEKKAVVENAGDRSYFAEEGTYSYTADGNIIEINEKQYRFEIKGSQLILTFVDNPGIADDEVIYTYTRG